MRTPNIVMIAVVAAMAAALLSASPALARNQDPRGAADPPSPGCSSYEKAPDGSWRQIPCAPIGAAAAPSRRRTNDSSQASTGN